MVCHGDEGIHPPGLALTFVIPTGAEWICGFFLQRAKSQTPEKAAGIQVATLRNRLRIYRIEVYFPDF